MPLELCRTASEFRAACDRVRASGRRLGLVPTMGALHAGHVALVSEARRRADDAAVTIFVNPTQFGPTEDFAKYPRTLESDLAKCEAAGAALVFAPEAGEMYPAGERTRVRVEGLTAHFCGRSRPGHFEGVTTIVAKLFAVAGACAAVFGRKDYQQLKVIQRMTRDLLLPVEVVGFPTVREPDGLALSSRNAYLSADDRARALVLSRSLAAAVRRFDAGERAAGALRLPVQEALTAVGLAPDYVTLGDSETLEPIGDDALVGDRALLALAVRVGGARLIDNVVLGEDAAPGASP
ncbi:MAG: pantoate--beta-alanine ligase [Polyangiaceae bacterium]|nr:pantoate--beta-alanine ligase [Polyangiaceae bacterium]